MLDRVDLDEAHDKKKELYKATNLCRYFKECFYLICSVESHHLLSTLTNSTQWVYVSGIELNMKPCQKWRQSRTNSSTSSLKDQTEHERPHSLVIFCINITTPMQHFLKKNVVTLFSPLLFTLYTHDCSPSHPSNTIIKFTDDTTIVGLISESAYRDEVEKLSGWCRDDNLVLNTRRPKRLWTTGGTKGPHLER